MKKINYLRKSMMIWHVIFAIGMINVLRGGNPHSFTWLLATGLMLDLAGNWLLFRLHRSAGIKNHLHGNIGDDLALAAGVIGILIFKRDFFIRECYFILLIDFLFLTKTFLMAAKFRDNIDIHTSLGRLTTMSQAAFLLLLFFLPEPPYGLFYWTATLTLLKLIQDIRIIHRSNPSARNNSFQHTSSAGHDTSIRQPPSARHNPYPRHNPSIRHFNDPV